MNRTLEKKLLNLDRIISNMKQLIISYSGGVDSSFLLYFCVKTLGKENSIAVTGVSEIHSKEELNFVKYFTKSLGVNVICVNTSELDDPNFITNPYNRCYFCKKILFEEIRKISEKKNIKYIADGTNYDDRNDYRPGRLANSEYNIASPLLEAELTKSDIREALNDACFDFFDKPSDSCLASRIPYNITITKDKLQIIENGETYIKSFDINVVRLRHHIDIARIEIEEKDFKKILNIEIKNKIINYLKKLGFIYVTFDLEGYNSGSMNRVIDIDRMD